MSDLFKYLTVPFSKIDSTVEFRCPYHNKSIVEIKQKPNASHSKSNEYIGVTKDCDCSVSVRPDRPENDAFVVQVTRGEKKLCEV
jgi:hypothetical protein